MVCFVLSVFSEDVLSGRADAAVRELQAGKAVS